jgi:hypothetical protein
MQMIRSIILAVAVASLGAACSPKGSAEKAGENIDSAIEEGTQGSKNLGDGPLEGAGESLDKATGNERTDLPDAAADAVDGKSSTKP